MLSRKPGTQRKARTTQSSTTPTCKVMEPILFFFLLRQRRASHIEYSLKVPISPSLPPKGWDDRHEPPLPDLFDAEAMALPIELPPQPFYIFVLRQGVK